MSTAGMTGMTATMRTGTVSSWWFAGCGRIRWLRKVVQHLIHFVL